MSAPEEQTRRLAENRERQIKLRDELAQLKREEMELTGACPVDSLKGLPKGQGTQRPKLLPQDYGNGMSHDSSGRHTNRSPRVHPA